MIDKLKIKVEASHRGLEAFTKSNALELGTPDSPCSVWTELQYVLVAFNPATYLYGPDNIYNDVPMARIVEDILERLRVALKDYRFKPGPVTVLGAAVTHYLEASPSFPLALGITVLAGGAPKTRVQFYTDNENVTLNRERYSIVVYNKAQSYGQRAQSYERSASEDRKAQSPALYELEHRAARFVGWRTEVVLKFKMIQALGLAEVAAWPANDAPIWTSVLAQAFSEMGLAKVLNNSHPHRAMVLASAEDREQAEHDHEQYVLARTAANPVPVSAKKNGYSGSYGHVGHFYDLFNISQTVDGKTDTSAEFVACLKTINMVLKGGAECSCCKK